LEWGNKSAVLEIEFVEKLEDEVENCGRMWKKMKSR